MSELLIREVDLLRPDKPIYKSARLARIERFAKAYRASGGDLMQAVEEAGDVNGEPMRFLSQKVKEYLAKRLYDQAVARNLIKPDKKYLEDVETIPKEELLSLLTKQARGERPTYRQEVLRKDPDTGNMEVVEVRSNFDEQKAQDLLAKILGLYEEKPAATQVNLAVVVDSLKGKEKEEAEDLLVEAHLKMLETSGSTDPEVVDVTPSSPELKEEEKDE